MIVMLALAVAASSPPPPILIPPPLPATATSIEYGEVTTAEVRLPISDSVRAATWRELEYKPDRPTTVRLACIVFWFNGAPGACVSAARLPLGKKTIDWVRARQEEVEAEKTEDPAALALRRTAERRISTLRMPAPFDLQGDNKFSYYSIRFFDETISSTDARPAFKENETLSLGDVTMAKPLDADLLPDLFPAIALRYDVTARVVIRCRIEKTLRLLCRDPGTVDMQPGNVDLIDEISEAFRLVTYQIASTIQLQPKDKDGRNVAGRDLKIALRWTLPEN